MKVYLIGSLRNPAIPAVGEHLRKFGHDVFDDWHAAGPTADDEWQRYEQQERGRTFAEALQGESALHTFYFDKRHLNAADAAVLVMPAGKSAHLEFGYVIGQGKRGYVLFPAGYPERWDVMYAFADGVFEFTADLVAALNRSSADLAV